MHFMKLRVVGMWHYFEETHLMAQIEMRYIVANILSPHTSPYSRLFCVGLCQCSVACRKYVPKKTTSKKTICHIGRFVSITDYNRPVEGIKSIFKTYGAKILNIYTELFKTE
jgi:hypothetical protein